MQDEETVGSVIDDVLDLRIDDLTAYAVDVLTDPWFWIALIVVIAITIIVQRRQSSGEDHPSNTKSSRMR